MVLFAQEITLVFSCHGLALGMIIYKNIVICIPIDRICFLKMEQHLLPSLPSELNLMFCIRRILIDSRFDFGDYWADKIEFILKHYKYSREL